MSVSTSLKSIVDIMRNQIPLFTLLPQVFLSKNLECDQETEIIVSSSFLLLITVFWSIWHSNLEFKKTYHHKSNKPLFISLHTFSSLLSFIALSYYMYDGKPYHCVEIFSYDQSVSYILLACSGALISFISLIEHSFWPRAEMSSSSDQLLGLDRIRSSNPLSRY